MEKKGYAALELRVPSIAQLINPKVKHSEYVKNNFWQSMPQESMQQTKFLMKELVSDGTDNLREVDELKATCLTYKHD